MDIGKSFAFVFEDENWIVKILIGAAILLVGILFSWVLLIPLLLALALLAGYSVEITRRVMRGELSKLPEWDNWAELLADGLKVLVIGIVYAIPIIVAGLCLGIPAGILSNDNNAFGGVLNALMSCLNLIWAVIISLLLPAAIAKYVAENNLGAAFRFGEVIALVRNNFTTYLLTLVMSWVANLIGQMGSIVCGIGWFATVPYALMVTGHLYGQAYVASTGQKAQPVAQEEAM
jgi:Sec-independent protein secretion pathway component TatC